MSGNYLLDTNALIALFARDASIEKLTAAATDVFLPVSAVGELFYGAEKSTQVHANLQRIEEIVARRKVLFCDTDTARLFGKIKRQLRAKGRPIPDNDIWIAAIAMQYQLPLVTRDAHFKEVDGLTLESW